MNRAMENAQPDVLMFYEEHEEVSAYSPEELAWYGQEITPEIVKPRKAIVTQQAEIKPVAKRRGRPPTKKR